MVVANKTMKIILTIPSYCKTGSHTLSLTQSSLSGTILRTLGSVHHADIFIAVTPVITRTGGNKETEDCGETRK